MSSTYNPDLNEPPPGTAATLSKEQHAVDEELTNARARIRELERKCLLQEGQMCSETISLLLFFAGFTLLFLSLVLFVILKMQVNEVGENRKSLESLAHDAFFSLSLLTQKLAVLTRNGTGLAL